MMSAATAEVIALETEDLPMGDFGTAPAEDKKHHYKFDEHFQTKIVSLCLRDTQFMQRTEGLVRPEYFENTAEAILVNVACRYFDKYRKVPGDATTLSHLIRKDTINKIIPKENLPGIVARLKSRTKEEIESGVTPGLLQHDISDRDFVVDQVAVFARHQAVERAILESVDHLDINEFDKIAVTLKKALDVGENSDTGEYNYGKMIELRSAERADRAAGKRPPTGVTTGYPDIDKHLYHKGWGKRELSVLMGGAKAGKCVTRDTIILTEDGMMEIGDYVPSTQKIDTFESLDLNVLGRNGMERASHGYNSGRNPTIRIKTQKGYAVEGTHHHPVLVMDSCGNYVWKRIDELNVGDWLPIQRGGGVFGKHLNIAYAVEVARQRIAESKRSDAMMKVNLPNTMTPELAEYLGMLTAEGHMGKRGVFSFTQKDAAILERFCYLTEKLFGIVPSIQDSHGTRIPAARVQSVTMQAYLEALGLSWGLSADKDMPVSVRRAPEDCVRAFISSVIGLDGSARRHSNGKVSFELTMASEKLIRQIQIALLNVGVVAKVTLKRSSATNGLNIVRNYWRLSVSGARNLAALRERVGLYEFRKQLLLGGDDMDSTARDWIPNARSRVRGFMSDMQAAGHSLKSTMNKTHWRMAREIASGDTSGVRELTYAFAEKLLGYAESYNFSGESVKWIQERVSEGFFYDRVTEVTHGEAETVDLSVPGTHSFFANGIISHNTCALIDFAINACGHIYRYNVLYVTLEVSAQIIAERMDANISDKAMFDLGTHITETEEKVKEWHSKAGQFIIREYPTGSMRVSDLRRTIERYKAQGIKFDLVVVDYADLMAPERYTDNSIENSKNVYVSLRGLAMQEDVAILTATQTNREGAKKMVSTMTDVADDFNKIRIADIVISINKTDEERRMNVARLFFAAVRNGPSNFTIRIQQDMDKMKFLTGVIGEE